MSSSRSITRRRTLALAAAGLLAGAGVLAGCSSSKSGDTSGGALSAKPSAHDAVTQAKSAVGGMQTVHLGGQLVVGKTPMSLDLSVITWNAGGTVEINGGTAQVRIVNGQLYVNGDTTFWDALKAGAGEQYSDGWVMASTATGPQFARLLSLVPTKIALDKLAPATAAWTEVAGRRFNGVDTVGLRDLRQNQGDTVYVAKDRTGYPVAIEFGKGGGLLTFTDWGKPVTAPVVPDDQILDATGDKIS